MKTRPLILLSALLTLAGALPAQTNSTIIAIDPAAGEQRIDGLQAFPAGLCWWKRGATTGGEFPTGYNASLGVQTGLSSYLISLTRGGPRYYVPPSPFIGGATRDGMWVYYTAAIGQDAGLWRKPQSATQNSAPELLTPVFSQLLSFPGAVQRFEGSIYSAPGYTNGYVPVWKTSFAADGSYAGETVSAEGILTPGLAVKKLVFYRFLTNVWGLALQTNGQLWRFGPVGNAGTAPFTALASGVGDITIRREGGSNLLTDPPHDVIYGVTVPSVRPGRLYTVSHPGSTISNVYTDPQNQGTLSLAADGNYLFISRSTALNDQSTGEVLRKYKPANIATYSAALETSGLPGSFQGWVNLDTIPGINLQADGFWLYFTRRNEVRRVSTIAPPRLDIHAFGIEAVQIVQSLNNHVRLIAGKPLTVRGYARLAENNASYSEQRPGAILEVFRNGAKIAQYNPVEPCTINNLPGTGIDLAQRRADLARSFVFDIPAAMIQRSRMRFQMIVNPTRSIVENAGAGVDPYINNAVSTPEMDVIQMGVPNLYCMTMDVADCDDYTLQTDPAGFWAQIARAKSLLPVSDIRVHSYPLYISKPVVRVGIPPVVMRSFDMREDSQLALLWLRAAVTLDNDPFRSGDNHYLGMVHPGIPANSEGGKFNGIGSNPPPPGGFLVVRMEGGKGTNDWDSPLGGRTLAHELAHNYDLDHIDQTKDGCGGERPKDANDSYPYNKCMFGPAPNSAAGALFGFDSISRKPIDGTLAGDLMSYHTTRWLSDDSFDTLLGRIPGFSGPGFAARQPRGGGSGETIFIAGTVDPALALAEFWPCQSVAGGVYDAATIAASIEAASHSQGHRYDVRQLDLDGNLLAASPLLLSDNQDDSAGKTGFAQFLRPEPGVRALILTLGGTPLARISVSARVPQISTDAPAYDAGTHTLRWSWTASDADNDPLFFTVQSSADDGSSWQTVQPSTPQQSVVLDTRTLPGTAASRLRVIATDGFHTAIAVSDPFHLPSHQPVVSITGAPEGAVMEYGDARTLHAFAMDAEEGSLLPEDISWTLTGPEIRTATGEALSLANLPPGSYTVTADAADSAGNPASRTLHFFVRPAAIPEGPAPVVDGDLSDSAWSSPVFVQLPVTGGTPASVRMIRSGGRVYLGLSDLPFRAPPVQIPIIGTITAAPASVSVYVDVNASGGGGPQPSDLALTLNEEGLAAQFRGNGTTMADDSPNAGVESVVAPGHGGWTAEISLPETMLGGADNGMNLMFLVNVPQPIAPPVRSTWPPSANPDVPDTWVSGQTGDLPPPADQPPVASAGPDRVLDPSESVRIVLDGTSSYDPESQPLTYQWTKIEGPSVALADSTTPQPSFGTGPVTSDTSWTFQLIVNDGTTDSAPATVTITAIPAGASAVVPLPEVTVQPDGSIHGLLPPDTSGSGPFDTSTGGLWYVEKSNDLESWLPLSTGAPDLLGRISFTDPGAASEPRNFYRAQRASAEGTLMPGSALSGDGEVRYVSVPHDDAFNSLPLTVSAWIKTTSTVDDTAGIVSKYNDASFDGWSLFVRKGRIRGWYLSGENRVFAPPLGLDGGFVADGHWHHVALVVNSAGGDLFVDGISRAHLNWTGTPAAPTTVEPVLIGCYDLYELGFHGEIDEVSIWSTAFSTWQVLDLIRRGPTGTEPDLTALWTCDDAKGFALTDLTPASRHGTLIGELEWVPSTAPIRR